MNRPIDTHKDPPEGQADSKEIPRGLGKALGRDQGNSVKKRITLARRGQQREIAVGDTIKVEGTKYIVTRFRKSPEEIDLWLKVLPAEN